MTRRANGLARAAGHGKATEIVEGSCNKIVRYTPFGYRKKTTHQYVPKTYLCKFGWKNTYYQHAECVVQLKLTMEEKVKIVLENI